MRTLLFLFITTLSFTLSKAQWVEINPGVDETLFDIYAITPDIVVAVGYNGTIIKSIDGGETWQQKDSGTTKTLRKVQFLNPMVGVIIGAVGTVLKTTDGGETWIPFNIEEEPSLWDVSIVNENLIFTCGLQGTFKTVDGGETWNKVLTFGTDWIQFTNDEIGYTKDIGDLFKTYNGGETWEQINILIATPQFIDENIGFFYADGLFKTIDGGYNFELIGYGEGWDFSCMYVVDENNTWGILNGLLDGDGSTRGIVKVHIMEDGTYTEEIWYDEDPTLDMASIHFADESIGYIVGYKNWKTRIWKNSTGANTMGTADPKMINEIKVYPNPASEEVNISFGKPISGAISVVDLTGKQIYKQEVTAKSKVSFNVENIAKGVYILSVITKKNNYSRKIIIN